MYNDYDVTHILTFIDTIKTVLLFLKIPLQLIHGNNISNNMNYTVCNNNHNSININYDSLRIFPSTTVTKRNPSVIVRGKYFVPVTS